jgi:hypothetical protein
LKKALVVSVLPFVLLFGGVAFTQSPNSVPGKLEAIESKIDSLTTQVNSLAAQVAALAANNKGPRKFYITKNGNTGSQALTACDAGYHMASLWEILDPTNLRYNTELGRTSQDSGFGPPNGIFGWIRTGSSGGFSPPPGQDNCDAWTSDNPGGGGSVVLLSDRWGEAAPNVLPWQSVNASCNTARPVWCVQD